MKLSRNALIAYGLALAIIVVDQISKAWLLDTLGLLAPGGGLVDREMWGFASRPILPPFLNFSFVLNDGVSFGLFSGGAWRWILSVFSIVVAALLAGWAMRANRGLLVAAIGMIMGGALGNVIDRIRFGGVVDFINVHIPFGDRPQGLFPWVFNVADSAITIGVVLLILDSLLSERSTAKARSGPATPAT